MSRRNYHQARKGELYCIEWPEWHVECAAEGCGEQRLVSSLGECTTLREAERKALKDTESDWEKCGDLWFCPQHKRFRV